MTVSYVTPPHRQPQAVFGGSASSSGGWMLLCKEFIMAEDSLPHHYAAHDDIQMQPWCSCW